MTRKYTLSVKSKRDIDISSSRLVDYAASVAASTRLSQIAALRQFLATAPMAMDFSSPLYRYPLPMVDQDISCVFYRDAFYISSTDILRALVFRFAAFGRPVVNQKKFEEYVFSDLRNLRQGEDARVEEAGSEFLEQLLRAGCVRTLKKQKVYYWFSVPHDKLFFDVLERDLRRESNGLAPATVAVAEPALGLARDDAANLFYKLSCLTGGPKGEGGDWMGGNAGAYGASPKGGPSVPLVPPFLAEGKFATPSSSPLPPTHILGVHADTPSSLPDSTLSMPSRLTSRAYSDSFLMHPLAAQSQLAENATQLVDAALSSSSGSEYLSPLHVCSVPSQEFGETGIPGYAESLPPLSLDSPMPDAVPHSPTYSPQYLSTRHYFTGSEGSEDVRTRHSTGFPPPSEASSSRSSPPPESRPFPCPYPGCGRSFKREQHCKRHVCSSHTKERLYGCRVCGKRFSRSDILSVHRRTHYKEAQLVGEVGESGF
ncbi:uncharacterized protein VTP21DRAFT_1925 [Calcarisporiella thermophila]|uniref:uncharacterized protein n=1 Tax=Calcarisporiella thermophila TaxID=911321 RepID=UPI003742536A